MPGVRREPEHHRGNSDSPNGERTTKLKVGTPLVLVNTTTGARYRLVLVAVENLVFATAWHDARGNMDAPTFHGRPYELLADKPQTKVDEAHGWEPHYERHVWVFRDNPNGVFSPFNPLVTCRHHKGATAPMGH